MNKTIVAIVGLFLTVGANVDVNAWPAARSPRGDERSQNPEPISKPAWSWTLEERLSRRFDVHDVQARYERAAREGLVNDTSSQKGKVRSNAVSDSAVPNVLIGRHNPELFLPFELFTSLISDGFSVGQTRRDQFRGRLAPLIAEFAAPETFWLALEEPLRAFVANQNAEDQALEALNKAADEEERHLIRENLDRIQSSQCELRLEALEAASAAVGQDELYRLLYAGIAPSISTSSREPDLRSRLLFIARGCQ